MMGPKTGENMTCETSVDVSKCSTTHEQADRRTKRKVFCDSMDDEDQLSCSKRRKTEGCVNTENGSLPTGLEAVVLDGKCEILSNIADMDNIIILDFDVNEFCIPRSESSETEITLENVNSIVKQGSDRATCMDSNLDFFESITLNEHSDRGYEHINDNENECDDDLSWLINFKVGALFNEVEVEYDHNRKGRKYEEIACQGMC
jgi:hypothetical protein